MLESDGHKQEYNLLPSESFRRLMVGSLLLRCWKSSCKYFKGLRYMPKIWHVPNFWRQIWWYSKKSSFRRKPESRSVISFLKTLDWRFPAASCRESSKCKESIFYLYSFAFSRLSPERQKIGVFDFLRDYQNWWSRKK